MDVSNQHLQDKRTSQERRPQQEEEQRPVEKSENSRSQRQQQQEYKRRKTEAIREILQENVQKATNVKDKKLVDKFNDGAGGR